MAGQQSSQNLGGLTRLEFVHQRSLLLVFPGGLYLAGRTLSLGHVVPRLFHNPSKEERIQHPDRIVRGSHEDPVIGSQPWNRLPPLLLRQHTNSISVQYVANPAAQLQEYFKCPLAFE